MKFDPNNYPPSLDLPESELRRLAQAIINKGGSRTVAESFIPSLVSEIIRLRASVCDPQNTAPNSFP